MSLLDASVRQEPTAADDAQRIKHVLAQTVMHMEHSLTQVHHLVQRHGRAEIAAALGNDADELYQVYQTLKATIQNLDPKRQPPNLPE